MFAGGRTRSETIDVGVNYNRRAPGKAGHYDRSVGSLVAAQGLWARMWGQVRKTYRELRDLPPTPPCVCLGVRTRGFPLSHASSLKPWPTASKDRPAGRWELVWAAPDT